MPEKLLFGQWFVLKLKVILSLVALDELGTRFCRCLCEKRDF